VPSLRDLALHGALTVPRLFANGSDVGTRRGLPRFEALRHVHPVCYTAGVIELPRRRMVAWLWLGMGVFMGLVGAFMFPAGMNIGFAAFGFIIAAVALQPAFASTPRFRATKDGVWFGGGAVIPWSEIKLVYNAGHAGEGMRVVTRYGRSTTIGFEFHQFKTLFKTPIVQWLRTAAAMGEVLVAGFDHTKHLVELKAMQRVSSAA
jgi:hypothetical protein